MAVTVKLENIEGSRAERKDGHWESADVTAHVYGLQGYNTQGDLFAAAHAALTEAAAGTQSL